MKAMTKKLWLAIILAPMLLLWSCVKEIDNVSQGQEGLHEVVFHAGWDGETKTVLQEDGSVYWSPGDEISLFDEAVGHGHYKLTATNTEPAASTDFVGKIGDNAGNPKYVAVYPYNSDNAIDKDGFHTTFPVVQTAKEGTFDKNLFVSVAISDNNNLYFRNINSSLVL